MLTQHYPQGWTIDQRSRNRFYIKHDGAVIETASTLKEARYIIRKLLTQ